MAFQEMLRLFPPFLVEPFKKWLRGLICGPTYCSRRCMEQHSWLPSPHQPRISISFYDCSKHISYWAAWEALTAADTLITKMSVTFLETDGRLFKKKKKKLSVRLRAAASWSWQGSSKGINSLKYRLANLVRTLHKWEMTAQRSEQDGIVLDECWPLC